MEVVATFVQDENDDTHSGDSPSLARGSRLCT